MVPRSEPANIPLLVSGLASAASPFVFTPPPSRIASGSSTHLDRGNSSPATAPRPPPAPRTWRRLGPAGGRDRRTRAGTITRAHILIWKCVSISCGFAHLGSASRVMGPLGRARARSPGGGPFLDEAQMELRRVVAHLAESGRFDRRPEARLAGHGIAGEPPGAVEHLQRDAAGIEPVGEVRDPGRVVAASPGVGALPELDQERAETDDGIAIERGQGEERGPAGGRAGAGIRRRRRGRAR